jgi:MATE family multidrug resistance protein
MNLQLYIKEFKSSSRLAGPIIISLLAQIGVEIVDTIMMGYLGPQALAAGALSIAVYCLILIFSIGLLSSVSVCIAQAQGAKKSAQETTDYFQQGLYIALIVSIPFALMQWQIAKLFPILGQTVEVSHLANEYLQGLCFGLPAMIVLLMLREYTASLGKPKVIMFITLIALPINIFLNYAFIFGRFGFSKIGMHGIGIGIASSLVQIAMCASIIWYSLQQSTLRQYARHKLKHINWKVIKHLLQIGVPFALLYLFEGDLFSVSAFLMGKIGNLSLAAHQITIQCVDVYFMIVMGTAEATAIRIAHYTGAKNLMKVKRIANVNLLLGIITAIIASIIFIGFPRQLTNVFFSNNDPQFIPLLAYTRSFFAIAACFLFFDAIQVITNNILRGIKDTLVPMLFGIGSYWLVGIGCAYFFAFILKLQGKGIWLGLAVGVTVSAVILQLRWRYKLQRLKNL